MKWDETFSVNHKEIDSQHKKLFELIDSFHSNLDTQQGTKPVLTAINEMKKYAANHFSFEEKYMQQIKFPGIKNHLMRHVEFVKKVIDLENKLKEGKIVLPSEIGKFLSDWIVNHIKFEDKRYAFHADDNKTS